VRVGLSWAGEVIASGFTNIDGYVTLHLSTPLQSGYTYYLTATAFNCLPATSSFTCQTEGEGYLNVADIAYNDNDDGVINPEEVIFLQITVHNPSQVDVADVYIWFNNLSDYIDFSWGLLHLGNIAAGSDKQVGNYLRISRDCPDYRNLQYELVLSSNGQSWKTPCMITVHSPVVSIVDCKLLPEKNWLNPGEEFQVQYKIANTGSGALKDTRCELVTDKDWLSITRPIQTNLSCPSNDSLLVTYTIRIDNVAQADSLFNLAFELTPANAPDKSCAENHLVLPENVMMEGFETNDNMSFLWEFPQGNTWQNDTDAYEGRYSFKTPQIDDNATTSAELKLELEQEGYMSFRYKVQSASTQYYLQLYVNDTPTIHCSSSVEWSTGECILYPGVNVLSWRFTGQGANDDSTACAWIDAIQFPRGTIFNDAQLMTDVTEINLTIHPEQVIYSPVYLTSADGRYVDYTAVLQKVAKSNPKSTNPSMAFNRDSIFPGTVDRYIVTLYNPLPDRELREVRLHIPAGIIVTGASNFTMGGQPSMLRVGSIGSSEVLTWISVEGNPADSLRCVLSLMTGVNQHHTVLNYEILTAEPWDFFYWDTGSVYLYTDGSESSFLTLTAHSGTLFEGESDRLAVKCNQSLMPEPLPDYVLQIYNNGVNMHSIPVSVTYDPTPGFDTSKTSLRAYPNPFRDNLNIDFHLPEDGNAEITLYNIRGQKVQCLYDAPAYAGKNLLAWNGKAANNRVLPTGIYLIKLRTSIGKDRLIRCLLVK
jgi:hypothetical protein